MGKTRPDLTITHWVMYRHHGTLHVKQFWTGTEWSSDRTQAKVYVGLNSVPPLGDPSRPVGADVGRAAFHLI